MSCNKWTAPLEQNASKLPQESWSAMQVEKWRDGTQHETQYNWLRYQPSGRERPQLFAVAAPAPGRGIVLTLLLCGLQGAPECKNAQRAFERHRRKGDKERPFSELPSDFDLHHPPCKSLVANNAYYFSRRSRITF